MRKELRALTRPLQFETGNLPLAASLLAIVPGSLLVDISTSPSVDGKRLFTITYPPDQEADANQVIEDFLRRRLVVGLYRYNQTLNRLRDLLHQQTNGERRHDEYQPDARRSPGLSEARV